MTTTVHDAGPSPLARLLGYGGLVPFLALAAWAWAAAPGGTAPAVAGLLGYGAVIASFLGAIHWGMAMREPAGPPPAPLAWGVLPGLVGWAAAALGGSAGLVLVAVLLWVCFGVDRAWYPRHRLQAWLPLRLQLTLVASLACLAAALAAGRSPIA